MLHSLFTVIEFCPLALTDSVEQSSFWEAVSASASREISYILWNTKVHYLVHKSPPPVPILSEVSPIHVLPTDFIKMILNIILTSTPTSSKWFLSLIFPHHNPAVRHCIIKLSRHRPVTKDLVKVLSVLKSRLLTADVICLADGCGPVRHRYIHNNCLVVPYPSYRTCQKCRVEEWYVRFLRLFSFAKWSSGYCSLSRTHL